MITTASAELDLARQEMENLDRRLIALIAERGEVARAIGRAKRASGMTTLDPAREAVVVRRAGELAREIGLDDEAVRRIFWQLIALSRSVQSG